MAGCILHSNIQPAMVGPQSIIHIFQIFISPSWGFSNLYMNYNHYQLIILITEEEELQLISKKKSGEQKARVRHE